MDGPRGLDFSKSTMHYQPLFINVSNGLKLVVVENGEVQNTVNLSKLFFGIKHLHAHLHYVCNIIAKYWSRNATPKALR